MKLAFHGGPYGDPAVMAGAELYYSAPHVSLDYAYAMVLDKIVFINVANRVRIRHQTIDDTNLDEFAVTPDAVGWPTNKVRIRHQTIQE